MVFCIYLLMSCGQVDLSSTPGSLVHLGSKYYSDCYHPSPALFLPPFCPPLLPPLVCFAAPPLRRCLKETLHHLMKSEALFVLQDTREWQPAVPFCHVASHNKQYPMSWYSIEKGQKYFLSLPADIPML